MRSIYSVEIILVIVLTLFGCAPPPTIVKHERDYQRAWCTEQQGQIEVRLADGTRVDCLTSTHAIEFDYAKKWAEAIGQSLYYAKITGKHPGIVLITTLPADQRYLDRLNTVAQQQKITVWTTTKD